MDPVPASVPASARGPKSTALRIIDRMLRRLFGTLARRPYLAGLLLRSAWRFRRRGWLSRPPFLPLPPPEYLDWRMHTAYGDESAHVPPRELERYLRWMRHDGIRAGRAES